jgi:hypothetical protein
MMMANISAKLSALCDELRHGGNLASTVVTHEPRGLQPAQLASTEPPPDFTRRFVREVRLYIVSDPLGKFTGNNKVHKPKQYEVSYAVHDAQCGSAFVARTTRAWGSAGASIMTTYAPAKGVLSTIRNCILIAA